MKSATFNLIFLLSHFLPLTTSIKLSPKVGLTATLKPNRSCQNKRGGVNQCIDDSSSSGSGSGNINDIIGTNLVGTTTSNPPPPAFLNFLSKSGKTDTTKKVENDRSPIPFSQQIIVLPAIMKMTATFLVPCTKEVYSFSKVVLKDTCRGLCTALSQLRASANSTAKTLAKNARKLPKTMNNMSIMITSVVQDTVQALIDFSEHVAQGFIDFLHGANSKGIKIAKTIVQVLTSVLEDTTKAIIEFSEHVVDGSIDFARGAKSWAITFSTYTYSDILVPMSSTVASFTTQVAHDVSLLFEKITVYTYRFLSSIVQDTIRFITNVSLDVADFVQHYSILWTQILLSTIQIFSSGVAQTIMNIPMWVTEITDVTLAYISMVLCQTKKSVTQMYKDSLKFLDEMIDVAPFLIRYQEDGQDKISLTPFTQMVLYVLSTVYATQPLWEQSCLESNKKQKLIESLVSNLQTRFFPPRTLFFAGALARGLQQSSTLKKSFHPTVGVGAMINFGAAALDERWINYIISGWFISGSMWTLFGSSDEKLQHEKDVEEMLKSKKSFW